MTGAEHYAEAERLLRAAQSCSADVVTETIAAAQVHATLALAAGRDAVGVKR